MDIPSFRVDVSDEVATILSSDFAIDVTETSTVPHSSDGAITFPNLDQKTQGAKLIETAVLYVDMRRSTELSLKHRQHVVARLYSAFVRAMTRAANQFGGEVRGIIGDRVMVLFDAVGCFEKAYDTAVLMNSVGKHVINKYFAQNEVRFGIGIDYGSMLATKTGIRKKGAAQQSYRSLVWLGRPANVASKLTDAANKPEDSFDLTMVRVAYNYGTGLTYTEEFPHLFIRDFSYNPLTGFMNHSNPAFHSFTYFTRKHTLEASKPPILMSQRVYNGFRKARPSSPAIVEGWLKKVDINVAGVKQTVYGGDIIYRAFEG